MSQQQQRPQDFGNFEDDIALFTNTDFFDFDLNAPMSDMPNDFAFRNGQQQGHPIRSPNSNDKMAYIAQQPAYYQSMTGYPNSAPMSASNSLPPSPPNGLPYAGHIQQSQPTVPSAHHFATVLSPQQQQHGLQSAGQKRNAVAIASPVEYDDQFRGPAEEDKRRRNTAASARFRVKKKQREQALEKTAKEMTDRVQVLEARIGQLEMENQWLKGLITEKNVKVDNVPMVEPEDKNEEAVKAKKAKTEHKPTKDGKEGEKLVQVETSLPEKKRGVGTTEEATKV